MSLTTLVAAAAAAAAAGLVLAPAGRPLRRRSPRASRFGPGLLASSAVAVTALSVTALGAQLLLAVILAAATVGVAILARKVRAAKAAERRQRLVVEVAEALVGELRAGQPPVTALEHGVELWSELETVVAAARLGADVPASLRRLAAAPGAEGLAEIASAWEVSERSGAGLATALAQVAETARARETTRHLVRGELASAQATARLVALLPVASLAMSAGIGGRPWHFLLATVPGMACLALGLAAAFAGLLWIDRIAAGVLRP